MCVKIHEREENMISCDKPVRVVLVYPVLTKNLCLPGSVFGTGPIHMFLWFKNRKPL